MACWGNTAFVRDEPGRAAITTDGTWATPTAEGHHWGTVCPTDPDYRVALLDRIDSAVAGGAERGEPPVVHGDSFYHCDRCRAQCAASDLGGRDAWQSAVISAFVGAAADRGAYNLLVTLYPDPYLGTSAGAPVSTPTLASSVDGSAVPLYGNRHGTTYWVESLALGSPANSTDLTRRSPSGCRLSGSTQIGSWTSHVSSTPTLTAWSTGPAGVTATRSWRRSGASAGLICRRRPPDRALSRSATWRALRP